jgi:hypothetical protein
MVACSARKPSLRRRECGNMAPSAMQSRPRQTSSRRSRHGGVAGISPLEWGAGEFLAHAWGKTFPKKFQEDFRERDRFESVSAIEVST